MVILDQCLPLVRDGIGSEIGKGHEGSFCRWEQPVLKDCGLEDCAHLPEIILLNRKDMYILLFVHYISIKILNNIMEARFSTYR